VRAIFFAVENRIVPVSSKEEKRKGLVVVGDVIIASTDVSVRSGFGGEILPATSDPSKKTIPQVRVDLMGSLQ